MRSSIRSTLVVLLTTALLYACTDDLDFDKIKSNSTSPEIAIPIVNSSLSLEDVVIKKDSNNIIQTNPTTGILEVIYSGSVFSTVGGQFVDIPNQNFNSTVSLPSQLPNPMPPGVPPVNYNTSFDIAYTTTVEVDSLLLKEGVMVFTLESTFSHTVDAQIVFPGIRNGNGQPLTISETLPPRTGSSPTVRSSVNDLNGFTLDMTKNGTTFNALTANIDVTVTPITGNSSSPTDRIDLTGEIRNMEFKEFSGYINQQTLQLDKDTISINMFKNFKSGSFFISNPTLEIDIKNSYGLPANMNFQSLNALNPDQANPIKNIVLPIDPVTNATNLRSLKYPTNKGVEITELDLDTNVSNIDDIISFLLKEIVYESEVQFNPNGRTSERNFFTDTSGIGLDILLKIPFEGRASGFLLVDTIAMDLSGTENLVSGSIRIIADNGFPIDVKVQMLFTDSLYNTIDSLFTLGSESIIPAAPIDANGDALGKSRGISDAALSADGFSKLSAGRYAIIVAELNTQGATQNRNVRFRPEYRLDIQLGLRAKVSSN